MHRNLNSYLWLGIEGVGYTRPSASPWCEIDTIVFLFVMIFFQSYSALFLQGIKSYSWSEISFFREKKFLFFFMKGLVRKLIFYLGLNYLFCGLRSSSERNRKITIQIEITELKNCLAFCGNRVSAAEKNRASLFNSIFSMASSPNLFSESGTKKLFLAIDQKNIFLIISTKTTMKKCLRGYLLWWTFFV